jgi:hypothetical protein
MKIRKLLSPEEVGNRNILLTVLDEIELSFSCFVATKLYGTFGIVSPRRREYVVFTSAGFSATLMSYRKLTEFFSNPSAKKQKQFPDDLRASYFGFQSSRPSIEKKDLSEINKYIAHLTKDSQTLAMRGMNIGTFAEIIYAQCFEFFDFLENGLLDRNEFSDRQILAKMYLIRRKYKNFKRMPPPNFLIAP